MFLSLCYFRVHILFIITIFSDVIILKHGYDQHHNHCVAFANLTYNGTGIEPILREANPENNSPALFADFTFNGIREAETTAFF